MTDDTIKGFIDQLNKEESTESIFTRQISENVDIAKVWEEQTTESDQIAMYTGSYSFFFIKNQSNEYVGAILDMIRDLHWYIIPKFRKQGYLSKALKETVLPYLFIEGRDTQRVTINKKDIGETNYQNSKNVALGLGFKSINTEETEFELQESDYNWDNESIFEVNSKVDPERFKVLRKRALYAYRLLSKISDELLMTVDDDKGLKKIASKVSDYTWKIEDIEWENNED
ncbi:hypothetical protein G3567_04700 [Psychroflexus sp. YR1-1]|uniref:Uncharacterized protein n=1 Tax=Psychroflexus aurantiacus TaxID=2709310 RepID=A0A6B3QZ42_9FLAO|nr:hypothetical protein [Psychroflexus aurantiacus]NEV93449.1 hypothetical protein [Psychroflexus aurantiacus]